MKMGKVEELLSNWRTHYSISPSAFDALRSILAAALRERAGAVPGGDRERAAFILGYKHGACHYIGGDSTEELHEAAEWAADHPSEDAGVFAASPSPPVEQAAGGGARNPLAETHAYLEQRVAKEMEGFRALTGERHG
jgi:hypothetical protein